MSESTLLVGKQDGTCILTLNRPHAMNSFSMELLGALHEALDEIAFDPEVRCVIVTAAGDKAFCAGADLKERAGMDPNQVRR
ncbi:MAG: enoyl-CoA hydratase-related protein, partial [Deferrisomatales bacterium]|nr:enoyl-CoA hydratase-related protein [Deferrisomatales bacterium]